jgi:hypothetical protein
MKHDMALFHSLGTLNCSSIERMGALILKEILRKETNKQETPKRPHYLLQCLRRFELKQAAIALLYGRDNTPGVAAYSS